VKVLSALACCLLGALLAALICPLAAAAPQLHAANNFANNIDSFNTSVEYPNVGDEDSRNPLVRHYREGETLSYLMTGRNQDLHRTLHYQVKTDGAVKKNSAGVFYEEYRWSDLSVNQAHVDLPEASVQFRESVSLDRAFEMHVPNMGGLDPILIGPVADLLNFYADLSLAMRQSSLVHAGDHVDVSNGIINSWADGRYTIIGEDAIDFEITLKSVDKTSQVAVLAVRHLPPEKSAIKLPAAWMHNPVADTSNNWVQVTRSQSGQFSGAVGKETIDVELKVSLDSGRILSATMDNVVEVSERPCTDAALAHCGEPVRYQIRRRIEMQQTLDHGHASANSSVPGYVAHSILSSSAPAVKPTRAPVKQPIQVVACRRSTSWAGALLPGSRSPPADASLPASPATPWY
jgi:hypothetical protein